MTKIMQRQFSVSTAEDQRNYFCGSSQVLARGAAHPPSTLPDGDYRIEDGRLVVAEREPGESVRLVGPPNPSKR